MFWKVKIVCVVFLFVSSIAFGQDAELDSLKKAVDTAPDDTLKVNALLSLAANYCLTEPAKAASYAGRAENLSTKIDYKKGIALSNKWLGIANYYQSNYYNALVYSNKSLNAFEALGDNVGASNILNNIGAFYADKGEGSKALEYYLKSLKLAQQSGNKLRLTSSLTNIGVLYSKNPATSDKALQYYNEALPLAKELEDAETVGTIYSNIGELHIAKNDFAEAFKSLQQAIESFGGSPTVAYTYNDLGKLFDKMKNYDSSLYYFRKGAQIAKESALQVDLAGSYMGIAQLYVQRHQDVEAIAEYKKAIAILKETESTPELKKAYDGIADVYLKVGDVKNAHFYEGKLNQLYKEEYESNLNFTTATFDYSMELQAQASQLDKLIKENELRELALEREKLYKNASIAILITVLIISVVLLFIIRQRKKLNTILYNQKEEIERQKQSVETALADLKSAQSQLIHSEKMASLGELTAGIAHEIQNPLNFVNNFSEVSKELLLELQQELDAGNTEEVADIVSNIIQNLQKINHHGKRADAIVKGMLQHSRAGSGSKELTNINAITEEYVRLAYLGLRAKDNSVKPVLKTDFDKSIGNININTADIGRVIVNLVSNAFYAIGMPPAAGSERAKQEPTVWVSTKKQDEKVLLTIRDNGPGIPKKVLEKIFQPFFTTKPTGQGTGLGLSLSYDIAKAHGGEILVDTQEGKGTAFTIVLPAA